MRDCKDCSLNYYPCNGEKRIEELESSNLDLQSELARKKYSLTVACNRVEELEDKLKVAVGALTGAKNAGNCWCAVEADEAIKTIEKYLSAEEL